MTGCMKPCTYKMYQLGRKEPSVIKSDFFAFSLWAASKKTIIRTEQLIYPLTSLVAEFGGTLGLFLGVSFITLWDNMFYLGRMCEMALKRYWFSRKNEGKLISYYISPYSWCRLNESNVKETKCIDAMSNPCDWERVSKCRLCKTCFLIFIIVLCCHPQKKSETIKSQTFSPHFLKLNFSGKILVIHFHFQYIFGDHLNRGKGCPG